MNINILIKKKYISKSVVDPKAISIGSVLKIIYYVNDGAKERLKASEGIVVAKKNEGYNKSFTLRYFIHGVGVEQIFPIISPKILSVFEKKVYKVSRAKLYFLRKYLKKLKIKS